MMLYIGIDNGVSGALGIIGMGDQLLEPMPIRSELNYQKAGKNITRLDYQTFKIRMAGLQEGASGQIRAIIEKPFVNPGNFVATSTSLRCLEAQLVCLEELGISRQYIDAKTWQKELLPAVKGRTELKKASLDIGMRMFPGLIPQIKKQKDADALFIAHFAQQHNL